MDIKGLLRRAYLLAEKESDDPVTKNAAIVLNCDGLIIGQGANRLPNKVKRDVQRLERPDKYDYIIHAEQNAIADAARQGYATDQSTMVCPWASCTFCARLIIQAGITKLITHRALMKKSHMKWLREIDRAAGMIREAGIDYYEFDETIGGIEHMFNAQRWNP